MCADREKCASEPYSTTSLRLSEDMCIDLTTINPIPTTVRLFRDAHAELARLHSSARLAEQVQCMHLIALLVGRTSGSQQKAFQR
jgi:uncharacterized protein YqiB (DUF1249 family)